MWLYLEIILLHIVFQWLIWVRKPYFRILWVFWFPIFILWIYLFLIISRIMLEELVTLLIVLSAVSWEEPLTAGWDYFVLDILIATLIGVRVILTIICPFCLCVNEKLSYLTRIDHVTPNRLRIFKLFILLRVIHIQILCYNLGKSRVFSWSQSMAGLPLSLSLI